MELEELREELKATTSGGAFVAYPAEVDGPLHRYIAALESEVETLKVCGNCGHFADLHPRYFVCKAPCAPNPYLVFPSQKCAWTPSRWTRRKA